jgi:hypothetical protein
MARETFKAIYNSLPNAEFVDLLISHPDVDFGGERDAMVVP